MRHVITDTASRAVLFMVMAIMVVVDPVRSEAALAVPKGKFMTSEELKQAIEDPHSPVFSNEGMAVIEKKEYPFLKDYVNPKTTTEDVRENLLTVLQYINQPWCYQYYLELLKDPLYQIRIPASEGMADLKFGVNAAELTAEISRQNSVGQEDRKEVVSNLVLAVGNTRDPKALEPLLVLYKSEKDSEVRAAYQEASAKLGYKKTIREIELELIGSDGFGKVRALVKVNYIDTQDWIEKVKPLLLDAQTGWTAPMGPATLTLRVCDLAVNTLRKIDPEKKITFPEKSRGVHYSEAEMQEARKAYAVANK